VAKRTLCETLNLRLDQYKVANALWFRRAMKHAGLSG
jgi:hypothetical protein